MSGLRTVASYQMSTLAFCTFDDQQFESICNLLCSTFNTSNAELLGFYESLRAGFHLTDWPSPVFANHHFLNSQDDLFQATYECAPTIACDLPSLLSRGGQKTIMLIAQDPYNKTPAKQVWIGTPYGLHVKKMREEKHTRRYLQLIDVLLHQGYRVYLTDIYKVYVHGVRLPRKDRQWFSHVLKQEVEMINPIAVITWGGKATQAVAKLGLNTPHHAYPHPSGNARSAWARLIGDRATDARILDYWQQSVEQQLEAHV